MTEGYHKSTSTNEKQQLGCTNNFEKSKEMLLQLPKLFSRMSGERGHLPLQQVDEFEHSKQEVASVTANETETEEDDDEELPLIPFLELECSDRPFLQRTVSIDSLKDVLSSSLEQQGEEEDTDDPSKINTFHVAEEEEHVELQDSPRPHRSSSPSSRDRYGVPLQISIPRPEQQTRQQRQDETWIFDPVDPLVQGRLPLILPEDRLQQEIDSLEKCLRDHLAHAIEDELIEFTSTYGFRIKEATAASSRTDTHVQQACRILVQFPETAQILYSPISPSQRRRQQLQQQQSRPSANIETTSHNNVDATTATTSSNRQRTFQSESSLPSTSTVSSTASSSQLYSSMQTSVCRILSNAYCYPLTFFCVSGNLHGVKAAYDAFPEAIAWVDDYIGSPLHYACHHGVHANVIQFLLDQYPLAARQTNVHYQTPLHLACANARLLPLTVLKAIVEAYPAAAQLADADGYSPFHYACQHGAAVPVLKLLLQASSRAVVHSCTRTMAKPLHVAAEAHPSVDSGVIQFLLQMDPSQASATDNDFQTPLHKACAALTVSFQVVQMLLQSYPGAIHLRDGNNERPYDLAVRLGGASPAVLELLQQDDNIWQAY